MPRHSKKSPAERTDAPDTARVYERAKPECESGMGRLDNNDDATPADRKDSIAGGARSKRPMRQINAEEEPRTAKKRSS